jgi:hypothetical protein
MRACQIFGTSALQPNLARVDRCASALAPAWSRLRSQGAGRTERLSAPRPGGARQCAVCSGPARPGSARCYQCNLHAELAPGVLADLVVPIAYAVKGGAHARNLWLYKSGRPGAGLAAARLRALLLAFLHDHGRCAWRRAGISGPSRIAVVPSGRGRPGPHPLRALVAPYLAVPWAELVPRRGGDRMRDLDPARFRALPRLTGANVLLLDDTWTSGASVQSAAMSLRLAGARCVIVIVLGRHVAGSAGQPGPLPSGLPYRAELCVVHVPPPPLAPAGRGAPAGWWSPQPGPAGRGPRPGCRT